MRRETKCAGASPVPELPEVETVRRGLAPALVGRRLKTVIARRADLRFPLPRAMGARLMGARLEAIRRRAKYLLFDFDDGLTLIAHLGMTGRFSLTRAGDPRKLTPGQYAYGEEVRPEHEHVRFEFDGGVDLVYSDPRRFGYMDLAPTADLPAHKLLRGIGPEPLSEEFTPAVLAMAARGRKTDLKAFLSDQRNVAGLGNIYVNEALFRAGLSPRRRASALATRAGGVTPHAERLVAAIREVLQEAITAGGSTLRDFQGAEGAEGAFQERFRVYGREGEPCPRQGCGGVIRRIVQGGRATFYCPVCQR